MFPPKLRFNLIPSVSSAAFRRINYLLHNMLYGGNESKLQTLLSRYGFNYTNLITMRTRFSHTKLADISILQWVKTFSQTIR
jgi:hypothetical protein